MLHFFLLLLRVLFNSTSNIVYKCNEFFKDLSKKSFELILDKKSGLILFFLCFIFLLSKNNFVRENKTTKNIYLDFMMLVILK